jgi:hypothetical protein
MFHVTSVLNVIVVLIKCIIIIHLNVINFVEASFCCPKLGHYKDPIVSLLLDLVQVHSQLVSGREEEREKIALVKVAKDGGSWRTMRYAGCSPRRAAAASFLGGALLLHVCHDSKSQLANIFFPNSNVR